jgi:hypothetical protein
VNVRDIVRRGKKHRLVLVDRGPEHLHSYQPTCACGWEGVPGKRPWAIEQYRTHRLHIENAKSGIGTAIRRQRVTPRHLLPELLR